MLLNRLVAIYSPGTAYTYCEPTTDGCNRITYPECRANVDETQYFYKSLNINVIDKQTQYS